MAPKTSHGRDAFRGIGAARYEETEKGKKKSGWKPKTTSWIKDNWVKYGRAERKTVSAINISAFSLEWIKIRINTVENWIRDRKNIRNSLRM